MRRRRGDVLSRSPPERATSEAGQERPERFPPPLLPIDSLGKSAAEFDAGHALAQAVEGHEILTTDPADLQASIDGTVRGIDTPCLAVFGRPATEGERERLDRMPDAQIEEWIGDGHFVHLVDPGRFAERLKAFVEHCDAAS